MHLHRQWSGRTILALLFVGAPTLASSAEPPLESEVVSLTSKDGVQLELTYYASSIRPGTDQAKQVAPVVLLHDLKDTRAVFGSLAARLQRPGNDEGDRPSFAVVTVDLRGHGGSTKQFLPNGFPQEIDPDRLNQGGLAAMVTQDMEAVRRWLVGKNDEAAFNLNKLCLVGAGMGANVAANWAAQDWTVPPLATGKQGQDVKALVLISPQWSYRGLRMQVPLRIAPLMQNVSWQIVYGGDDSRAASDVRRIQEQFDRFYRNRTPGRGEAGQGSGPDVLNWKTSLQGGKLLSQFGGQLEDQIIQFLVTNVAQQDLPWIARRTREP